MPRKPFDPRILRLANEARTKLQVNTSLDPIQAPTILSANQWEWADVTLTCSYAGIEASYTDTGVSVHDEDSYRVSPRYTNSLMRALAGLLSKLDKAAEGVAALGGGK